MDYQKQSLITRTIIKAAVLMSEFGAESILIEQTAQRLGKALGMDSVEISLIPSAIVLTTLKDSQCITTTRRVHHKPINMSIVCEIQKIVINIEKQNFDANYLVTALKDIEPNKVQMNPSKTFMTFYILANEMPPEGEVGTRYREFLTKMCGKLKKWDDTRLYIGNTGYGLGKSGDIYDVHRYWGWYYNTFLTYLNMRDNAGLLPLQHLFNHLHIVDDLVMSINNHLPPQRPIGWQLLSQNKNFMNLPTVGVAGDAPDYRGIEQSLAATVIQFLGVACYHHDRGYFVGHIVGYLFSCYYFAHLGIGYAVTPLKSLPQASYPYQSVSVTQLVRLLQELDETLKTQVYQLAIYCAQISEYALEKRIEKLLITEVNSFNKQALRDELSVLVQYDLSEKEALFQPIKPLK